MCQPAVHQTGNYLPGILPYKFVLSPKINVNESCSEFFDLLVAHSLFPKITLPTRFANDSATLIDNLFCKLNKPTHLTTAGILLNKLSDHQPCFILLDTDFVHHKHPTFIKIYKQNDDVIENIKHEISNSEQLNKIDINLTADPNVSYGIIHEVIEKAKNKHMLSKLVKFDKYKHKQCEWIKYGLLKSIRFRDKLY